MITEVFPTTAMEVSFVEGCRQTALASCPQIVGTPTDIADQLQDLFDSDACDGFELTPTVFPGTFEQFARSVVPELQSRGVFRLDYEGMILRENLLAGR